MNAAPSLHARFSGTLILLAIMTGPARPEEEAWVDLTPAGNALKAWKAPLGDWTEAASVGLSPTHPKLLAFKPGKGLIVNGPKGRARDLVSKELFGDIEAHVEFMVPKRSNSGVKLQGLYEIQIFDSFGVKKPTASDCGGIYPRAELEPSYHHIDKGTPPKVNACKPAGEWQALDIVFLAPRFDADGKKIANARFLKVALNGTLIHENVSLNTPTGHAWHQKEIATGPLLLQGDHGPVAFRNVRVRAYRPLNR